MAKNDLGELDVEKAVQKQPDASDTQKKQAFTAQNKLTFSDGSLEKTSAANTQKKLVASADAQKKQSASAGAQKKQTASAGAQKRQTASAATQKKQAVSAGAQKKQAVSAGTQKKQAVPAGAQKRQTASAGAQKKQAVPAGTQKKQQPAAVSTKKPSAQSKAEAQTESGVVHVPEAVQKSSGGKQDKPRRQKKKMSVGKKVALVILCLILVLVIAVGVLAYRYLGLVGSLGDEQGTDVTVSDEERNTSLSNLNSSVYNILLVGVDSRKTNSYSGRSDSMIIISINKEKKKLVMTSVLRDSYVSIPGYGNAKLNAAYQYGGTSLLEETIAANYGISIDNVAVVNFQVVADFVDAVGGVDVNVSTDEIKYINKYINSQSSIIGRDASSDQIAYSEAGDIHLNGNQALAYSRIRYVGTDFARTQRQRTVLTCCMEKMKDMSLSELNSLATEFLPKVHTDLTSGQILSLVTAFLQASDYTVESISLPKNGTWSDFYTSDGQEALQVDFETNKKYWEEMVS